MVVALPPVLNENACLLHGHEFFAVQAFVPETAVEALDVTVLPGTTWLDETRFNLDFGEKAPNTA